MNLPLHTGWLGVLEASAIALAIGFLVFLFWHFLCRRLHWSDARAVGWACAVAVALGAGIDTWKLFYLGMMKLESPLYARLALAGIHDAERLGARVVCEILAALCGVGVGWLSFSRRGGAPQPVGGGRTNEKTAG